MCGEPPFLGGNSHHGARCVPHNSARRHADSGVVEESFVFGADHEQTGFEISGETKDLLIDASTGSQVAYFAAERFLSRDPGAQIRNPVVFFLHVKNSETPVQAFRKAGSMFKSFPRYLRVVHCRDYIRQRPAAILGSYGQHLDPGRMQHVPGDGADREAAKAGVALRSHDDQTGIERARNSGNSVPGVALLNADFRHLILSNVIAGKLRERISGVVKRATKLRLDLRGGARGQIRRSLEPHGMHRHHRASATAAEERRQAKRLGGQLAEVHRAENCGHLFQQMQLGGRGDIPSPLVSGCIWLSRMELTAEHLGDSKFAVITRGHRVICDQPPDNGGEDAGMSPPEFLLASLAACAGYYAAQYLKTRNLPAEGLAVRVEADKELKPARLASFRIDVTTPDLDERHSEGVLRAVKACLIHNTLLAATNIEVALIPAHVSV